MCTDQYQEANRAQALVSAWMNASANSIALVAEREASALDSIKKVFSDHQLSLKDDDALPSSEDVATLIRLSDPDEAATFVSGLTQALQEAASTGPRWLADRITDYCSAIAGYAAAEAGSHVSAQTASVKAASPRQPLQQIHQPGQTFERWRRSFKGDPAFRRSWSCTLETTSRPLRLRPPMISSSTQGPLRLQRDRLLILRFPFRASPPISRPE